MCFLTYRSARRCWNVILCLKGRHSITFSRRDSCRSLLVGQRHDSLLKVRRTNAPLFHVGSRNTLLVKAALEHRISLADEDVGRDFIFSAPKLSESRKKHQVVKCFDWERQTKRSRFRAVFGPRHGTTPHRLQRRYYAIITLDVRIESWNA